jgi:hypothetical protein
VGLPQVVIRGNSSTGNNQVYLLIWCTNSINALTKQLVEEDMMVMLRLTSIHDIGQLTLAMPALYTSKLSNGVVMKR